MRFRLILLLRGSQQGERGTGDQKKNAESDQHFDQRETALGRIAALGRHFATMVSSAMGGRYPLPLICRTPRIYRLEAAADPFPVTITAQRTS